MRARDAAIDYSEHGPSDEHGADIGWNEIHDALYPLCDDIVRLPVRTIADLVLLAQVTALLNYTHWTGEEESESGEVAMRVLVDNVCQLVGAHSLPGVEVVPIEVQS
jgi:hypothetical protein